MQTLSHPSTGDRSLTLPPAVDARSPEACEQSLTLASPRGVDAKKFVSAERDPISQLYPIETGAVALYKTLPDGRRQVVGFAFVIAARGGVPMAVQAMKAGAVGCIEMPVGREALLASVERALHRTRDTRTLSKPLETDAIRVAGLTTRQRQVLDLVLAGYPSKNIAADLGISQRTVDNHRAAIMRKTCSKSIPGLVRTALATA